MSAASAAPDPFIFSYAELLLDSSLLKGHEHLEIEKQALEGKRKTFLGGNSSLQGCHLSVHQGDQY